MRENISNIFANNSSRESQQTRPIGSYIKWIVIAIIMIALAVVAQMSARHNDDQNWQIVQSVNGTVTIRDTPGWYFNFMSRVWTWPRAMQKYYSKDKHEGSEADESFRVTFNDGGNADMSTYFRIQTPTTVEHRRKAHRDFGGNPNNMLEMVRAHMISCAKASAPLMSASENQSARKAEYQQLVERQMNEGLYEMRKVLLTLKDQTDEKGNAITVAATEIVTDTNGVPKIVSRSPLAEYDIKVLQFSVTATDYDPTTIAQFEAKKKSFLAAEQSKAQRGAEVQERLMIIEKGLREKAEVEAVSNKEKAAATIAADREKQVAETKASQEKSVAETQAAKLVAVALQTKLEAETKAAQEKSVAETQAAKLVAVAQLTKQEAETKAAQELAVAKLARAAAEENAAAIRTLAAAQEEKIKVAGAITEKERTLAEIKAQRDVGVAKELAQIESPKVIMTGTSGGTQASTMDSLISMRLLQATGVLDSTNKPSM